MQQQTHSTSNKIPRQPKKIWKQVLLRKTKEKLYPKVLDNYRGSRDMNLGQTQNLRHSPLKAIGKNQAFYRASLSCIKITSQVLLVVLLF